MGLLPEDVPVVLAPMAGITNRAFRRLCREQGAGLYVSEMITSRALVERNEETLDMVTFAPDESPRSVQLYGVDPATVAAAVRIIVDEDRADHIDLNMGCPVPKVTRKGGGAALPWKLDLFREIVRAAVCAAGDLPVTVKMRKGIDDDHLTYLDAGQAAAEEGVAWVALHGRTAIQLYSGQADWDAIARLVEHLDPLGVPVLGNGDVFSAQDALDMVARTGAAGVVVGRGCLGRPWLFAQLAAAFRGEEIPAEPTLGEVVGTMRHHAELLGDMHGERRGCIDFRKHVAWYLKGFTVRQPIRAGLALIDSLEQFDALVADVDLEQSAIPRVATGPRGRTSGQRRVVVPDGWLDDRACNWAEFDFVAAEQGISGG